jgi:hypothetical protein
MGGYGGGAGIGLGPPNNYNGGGIGSQNPINPGMGVGAVPPAFSGGLGANLDYTKPRPKGGSKRRRGGLGF